MKNIIFIAPPAGGKGTLSDSLVENFGYIHISTGDLLRSVSKTSEIGKKIDELISQGKFVSDEIVLSLLKDKLKTLKENESFILDGFPRNLSQAELLDKLLLELNMNIDAVYKIDVPYDVCLKRAIGRINCPNCKTTYNKFFKAPVVDGVCDKCGNSLVMRDDDNEITFKSRYDTYLDMTLPLCEFYKEKGILVNIDGINDPYEQLVSMIND